MTVQELITQLQQLDPNARVFRYGYEAGLDDVITIRVDREIALDVYDSWYFGSHEKVMELDKEQLEGKVIVKGVII